MKGEAEGQTDAGPLSGHDRPGLADPTDQPQMPM
jgi:hypothetical protein